MAIEGQADARSKLEQIVFGFPRYTPAAAMAALLTATLAPSLASAHPDIEGVWMVRPEYYLGQPLTPKPQLSPAAEARRAMRAGAEEKGYVRSVSNMLCLPSGGPQMFSVRSPFEIFEGFGRITFIFETEGNNQPRTIYLNEATHGDAIYPSFNGHSIGHWEGDVLVVDTIGFNGRGTLHGGVPKSEKTHLIERFSWSPDGKSMSAEITAEDPVYLAQPWTTTLKFDRLADTEERFEVWCEPDLDAFNKVDLNAVKDFDPEVARMLDPATRASDPALKFEAGAK